MRRTATYIAWSACLALLVSAATPTRAAAPPPPATPRAAVTVQVWDCRGNLATCKLANGAPLPSATAPTSSKSSKKARKMPRIVLGAR
ncbi:MAG TPA: hypothetical protein VFH51_13865 [Myxococcota bacterium]|nr:hypothetical protein [Myxococcota bacterium]